MTSCPAETDLLALVDGDLDASDAEVVLDHLAACAPCAALLARSEASLCYALGGLADQERAAGMPRSAPQSAPHVSAWTRLLGVAAALLVAAGLVSLGRSGTTPGNAVSEHDPVRSAAVGRIDQLIDRARALSAEPLESADTGAVAAFAAAAARERVIGPDAARTGYLRVIEAFPRSDEARRAVEELDRLSTFGGTK